MSEEEAMTMARLAAIAAQTLSTSQPPAAGQGEGSMSEQRLDAATLRQVGLSAAEPTAFANSEWDPMGEVLAAKDAEIARLRAEVPQARAAALAEAIAVVEQHRTRWPLRPCWPAMDNVLDALRRLQEGA